MQLLSRRHFERPITSEAIYRPEIKVFPKVANIETIQKELLNIN